MPPVMRCNVCKTDNPPASERCTVCGAAFDKRARKRSLADDLESPFARTVEGPNRRAIRAYRLTLYSLIPFAGLALGPVALGLAVRAWLRGRRDPAFTASRLVGASLILGALTTLTNWAGVGLMWVGWRLV